MTSSQNNSPQTTGPPAGVASHDAPGPGRLPRHVLPRHYALELFPNLDTGTFSGTVAIDVDVMAACNEVVLHAADLEVASAVAVIDG
ncbi:MAG: hypothetical protein GY900_06125, partial [Actinomycetia bacterium]|nr:hypothetical protein [Actinomycetes bacterium]